MISETTRLKSTVFACGLDSTVTKETLYAAFLPFGPITEVLISEPRRGFGFVEFGESVDAAAAIDNMHQSILAGKELFVEQVKPRSEVVLDGVDVVWEQEGWLQKYQANEEGKIIAWKAEEEVGMDN